MTAMIELDLAIFYMNLRLLDDWDSQDSAKLRNFLINPGNSLVFDPPWAR
jgi:hypothetical protein